MADRDRFGGSEKDYPSRYSGRQGLDVRNPADAAKQKHQFQYRDQGRTVVSDREPAFTDMGWNRNVPRSVAGLDREIDRVNREIDQVQMHPLFPAPGPWNEFSPTPWNELGMRQGIPDSLYNKKTPTDEGLGILGLGVEDIGDPFAQQPWQGEIREFDPFEGQPWQGDYEGFDPFKRQPWQGGEEGFDPFINRLGGGGGSFDSANLWQTWQKIKDRIGQDAADEWLAGQETTTAGGIGSTNEYQMASGPGVNIWGSSPHGRRAPKPLTIETPEMDLFDMMQDDYFESDFDPDDYYSDGWDVG